MQADRDIRAMLLAAGYGTRLRPLTESLPKPLVRVLDVPLIDIALELVADAGIREVAINLHYCAAELRRALHDSAGERHTPFRITLYDEPTILGTGGGVRNAYPSLRGADAVVLMNADTLVSVDLKALLRDHLESGAAATLLLRPNPDPVAYAPVLTDDDRRIRRIAGLPSDVEPSGLNTCMFAGAHVLAPRVIELLPEGVATDINRALHPRLIAAGEHVRGHVQHAGAWWDIGTPERLLAANLGALRDPPPALATVVRRRGIERRGDSVFGPAVAIAHSEQCRESVVGNGCVVESGATIEQSVLFPSARVGRDARVRRSIIGPGVDVPAAATVDGLMLVAGSPATSIATPREGGP